MKRIVLAAFLLLVSAGAAHAQDPEKELQEFRAFQADQESLRAAAWSTQDFREAIRVMQAAHDRYETLGEAIKADLRNWAAGNLYNLACAYALLDSAGRALDHLDRSAASGYSDYEWMEKDADLASLREEPRYGALLASLRERYDYLAILRREGGYAQDPDSGRPIFTYQAASDSPLVRLRTEYGLDSVAGSGDEASRIIHLMRWAHRIVRHDGSSTNPPSRNALDIIRVCREEDRGVNCRMMATILNEACLAMGFPSRHITCMPKDTLDPDCHVITAVYSRELGRWLWMDPTFEAYVQDPEGALLGIAEVRERLIRGDSLVVAEGINWNGQPYGGGAAAYLRRYMAKNLYRLWCPVSSEFGFESLPGERRYASLVPAGYVRSSHGRVTTSYTGSPEVFWARPGER
jgi:hypothetical protein